MKGPLLFLVIVGPVVTGAVSCGGGSSSVATPAPVTPLTAATPAEGGQAMTLVLSSTAFAAGEAIPAKYTCNGDNTSPPLQWSGAPPGTQSLALVVDDPDAPSGTFVHWVIYDLPPEARGLPEGVPTDGSLPDGSFNGKNGANQLGYTGPCPPSGTHHYHFKLYALDVKLEASAGWSKDQLVNAMQGHVPAEAELVGLYSKP